MTPEVKEESRTPGPRAAKGWSFDPATLFLCACFALFSGLVLTQSRVFGSNDGSRWDTVWSLTTGRGYIIDGAPFGTADRVVKDGHVYSSKPPLLPTAAAALFAGARATAGALFTLSDDDLRALVLIVLNVAPFVYLLIRYERYLREGGFGPAIQGYCLMAAACGTFLTTYLITINNHSIAAYCAFFAVGEILALKPGVAPAPAAAFRVGLFSALAAANEFPAVALPLGALVMLHETAGRRAVLAAALPGALCALLVLGLDYLAYGNVIPFYLTHKYYHYPGSYWDHPSPIDALHEAKPVYFLNLVAGHHGMFSLSPVFLVALAGLASPRFSLEVRRLALLCVVSGLAILVFATRNYGGNCQGPRWTFWMIPFFLFALPWGLERARQTRTGALLAWGALALSCFSAGFGLVADGGPWGTSWLHLLCNRLGWVSY